MDINMLNNAINSLGRQLSNIQTQLTTRAEDPDLPSAKDVATQVRLIQAIDKLQKMVARMKKEEEQEAAKPVPQRYSDPAPYGAATMERYMYLLKEHNAARRDDVVVVEGKEQNRRWMIYNIFQYLLPEEERMYIEDLQDFRNRVHMGELSHKIAAFLNQPRTKAA